jgi:hypothetical protein
MVSGVVMGFRIMHIYTLVNGWASSGPVGMSSRAERGIGSLMSVSIETHSHALTDPSLRSG